MRISSIPTILVTSLLSVALNAMPTVADDDAPRVSVIVGSLLPEEGGAGSASDSPLKSPFGVDFDPAGNMFIVELEGGRVHKRTAQGLLTQISGDGTKNYSGDGGPARRAQFNGMHNVAVTPDGNAYIADSWNHCIRKIDARTGEISTVAGTGEAGFGGDGGVGTSATFNFIMCITLNHSNDALHIADLKNLRVRVLDLKTGIVQTVAGNGQKGIPADGALAKNSPLVDPRAVAADSQDNIYILERGGQALRVVSPDGKIRTVAGAGDSGFADGLALEAQLKSPKHLCVDGEDNVYIADDQNRRVRKYDPQAGTLTTVLGEGIGTPPIQLLRPHGVCVENNRLYVVDTGHNRILRIENPLN